MHCIHIHVAYLTNIRVLHAVGIFIIHIHTCTCTCIHVHVDAHVLGWKCSSISKVHVHVYPNQATSIIMRCE